MNKNTMMIFLDILYHYLHHKLYFRKRLDFRITCLRNYTLVASITIS